MESFYKPVGLWMICSCETDIDAEELVDVRPDFRCKLRSSITGHCSRQSESGYPSRDENARERQRGRVGYGKSFWPSRETVDYRKEVS